MFVCVTQEWMRATSARPGNTCGLTRKIQNFSSGRLRSYKFKGTIGGFHFYRSNTQLLPLFGFVYPMPSKLVFFLCVDIVSSTILVGIYFVYLSAWYFFSVSWRSSTHPRGRWADNPLACIFMCCDDTSNRQRCADATQKACRHTRPPMANVAKHYKIYRRVGRIVGPSDTQHRLLPVCLTGHFGKSNI